MSLRQVFCLSFSTPFGWLTITSTSQGLNRTRFGRFCARTSDSELLKTARKDILDFLVGNPISFYTTTSGIKYPLDVSFTPSQDRVFNVLNKIPYGTTISYKELAKSTGTSPRACGKILASNPLPIIIPCHRVICANGNIGGYSGGLNWKRKLLQLENSY